MTLSRRSALGLIGAAALPAPILAGRPAPSLLLVDPRLAATRRGDGPGVRIVPIEGDLVRMWREGLGREIAAAPAAVVALVGYDKALLLAGLAREDRLTTQRRRIDARSFEICFGRIA